MNGVSNITDKILQEARSWSDAHLKEAKAEAEKVSAQYTTDAAAQTKEILAGADQKAAAAMERAKSQAEMDRRKSVLAMKQKAVGDTFGAALQSLADMPEEDRALLMVRMVIQYQTQDAELIFNGKDQKTVGPAVVETVNAIYTRNQLKETFSGTFLEKVKKLVFDTPAKHKVVLSEQVGSFSGGFILKEGDIENNCTFEVLLNAVRDELEGEVSSILFQ